MNNNWKLIILNLKYTRRNKMVIMVFIIKQKKTIFFLVLVQVSVIDPKYKIKMFKLYLTI